jgi:hypothetical protein
MGLRPWFATREQVAATVGYGQTVGDIATVDRACADATDSITKWSGWRNIHPVLGIRYFDRPADDYNGGVASWRLDLGRDILVAAGAVTAGGASVPAGSSGYYVWPATVDEPVRELRLDRSGNATWSAAVNTPQNAIAVTGDPWGWSDDAVSVGTLASALNDTSGTTLDLSANRGRVGVGTLLRIDNERFVVSDMGPVATGDTLAGALEQYADNAIPDAVAVADGTDYEVGEVLAVDAEQMQVERVVGNTLYVKRAVLGSHLAAHTIGTAVYAYRRATVERGSVGSAAATHAGGAAVTAWAPPAPLVRLAVALAVDTIAQEGALYGRSIGAEDNVREMRGTALAAAWKRAMPYKRQGRTYAV